jgi:hypothetical protein
MEQEGILRPLPNDVLRYVAALRKSGLAGHSVNAYMQVVRVFYRWAETQNLYPAIGRSVRGVKVKKDEPLDCLAREGVAALLEHCGLSTKRLHRTAQSWRGHNREYRRPCGAIPSPPTPVVDRFGCASPRAALRRRPPTGTVMIPRRANSRSCPACPCTSLRLQPAHA